MKATPVDKNEPYGCNVQVFLRVSFVTDWRGVCLAPPLELLFHFSLKCFLCGPLRQEKENCNLSMVYRWYKATNNNQESQYNIPNCMNYNDFLLAPYHLNTCAALNTESACPDQLKKPVADGDDVYITVMLAGG
ncbi:hypothetical protein [Desulfosarcina variabilis]|uniref:hypothetical protein n=1 Tax=Desulfosarcina variabilis TaxID=2300 RepID=UPI003AFB7FB3